MHVAARSPVRVVIGKLQADSVVEHVWRSVKFDVQGAYRRAATRSPGDGPNTMPLSPSQR
jgi:hypothetical protein